MNLYRNYKADGHRPVSEKYRTLSDIELEKAFEKYGVPMRVIGGSQIERLEKIIEFLDLPVIVPVTETVKEAEDIIASNRETVSQRIIEQYKKPTLKEKAVILSKL